MRLVLVNSQLQDAKNTEIEMAVKSKNIVFAQSRFISKPKYYILPRKRVSF